MRVLWQSEPLHDLALMVARHVPEEDAKAIQRAFLNMAQDPQGSKILQSASELVKLPASAVFISSNGSEYVAYRNFYPTAPVSLR